MFTDLGIHESENFGAEHFLLVARNVAAERGSSDFIKMRKLPDNCDDSIDENQTCLDVDARFPAVKILADLSVVISVVLVEPEHQKT